MAKNSNKLHTVLPNVKKGVPEDRKANIELYNEDNMTLMARYPDNYFDVAIVDPPYDFSTSKTSYVNKNTKFKDRFQRKGGEKDKGGFVVGGNHKKSLQEPPKKEYFDELFRVSKNQIIWGGQTFANLLPNSMEWIFWDKRTGGSYFADGELAWTSFGGSVRMFRPNKLNKEIKIHPTQKPVELYCWTINRYCKQGYKVLDTHLGSGSIAVACHKYGIDLVGCEIDKEYYNNALKRLENEQSQQSLF